MFKWDPEKAAQNLRKHEVDFAEAVLVFEDELALTMEDPDEEQDRFVMIGMDALGRVLVVVYAYEEDEEDEQQEHTRIISARKADKRERKQYEG